jgi:hypothetical protein
MSTLIPECRPGCAEFEQAFYAGVYIGGLQQSCPFHLDSATGFKPSIYHKINAL